MGVKGGRETSCGRSQWGGDGKAFSRSLIEEIAQSIHIPVEVGGGIRDLETIENYLSSGVEWVILGTAPFRIVHLIEEACHRFPGRVILAIDARGGKVAIQGWKEVVSLEAIDLAKQFEGIGSFSDHLYRYREGWDGDRFELGDDKGFSPVTSIPVIASGGVSRIEEIEHLMELESDGVIGVIVGRALYTGRLDLEEAIRVSKRSQLVS